MCIFFIHLLECGQEIGLIHTGGLYSKKFNRKTLRHSAPNYTNNQLSI